MEERSNVVIWEIGEHGRVLLPNNITAKLKWAEGGGQQATLEIPVTCHYLEVGGHAVRLGTNVVLLTEDGTRFDVSVKLDELPKHIAAMVGASSSR
ncbi:hypothetical protein HYW68_00755 [Candidatus Parcubacteria bacterium]|nr:hypothetical protein [Candidatus Parcubacteria bacterium]